MQTLEQQLAAIMAGNAIDVMQISAVREGDGVVRFYTCMHGREGICVHSDSMNMPAVREAVQSGVDALVQRRALTKIADLAPMAEAA